MANTIFPVALKTALVIDDHELFLDGITQLLEHTFRAKVFTASTAKQAREMLASNQPDITFVDISLPDANGLDLIAEVAEQRPDTAIIALTANQLPMVAKMALDKGALGFVPKSADTSTLLRAIECVLNGETFAPDTIPLRKQHLQSSKTRVPTSIIKKLSLIGLTARQYEILILVTMGYSNSDIGQNLHLAEATVKSHISALMKALKTRSRLECIYAAKIHSLLPT